MAGVLDLGAVRIHWLRGGRFRLDGGAMFGPVPKPLWRRRYPCDQHNSIPMQAYPLLVLTPKARLLIEAGIGHGLSDKQRRNFRVEALPALEEDLARLGLKPADIDFVVYTHMDWDHTSGGVRRDGGDLRPAFPRARYVVQRAEWVAATNPDRRTRHGYWPENWQPLWAAGQVELVDGDVELVPGVHLHLTGGHTHGHQAVRIEAGDRTVLHLGDLLPTHAHLNPLWVMAYDNFPLTSVAQKERWLGKAQSQGWWLTFYHDPFVLAAVWDQAGQLTAHVPGELGFPPPLD
ncbi:MAG: MBL fold metallo-hydrolase [Limnochordales bacterium]|nr:MBL fold metallo-hydrolase [Limnochordales bacterium]